ncbi:MAG TPA: hypothetical protein VJ952_05800 [Opitutales bacterium]|nr:hypothetical protein [Opitutales bacterium]
MKTTLNLRDDLVRRAKARAALRGQPLARYVEEGLEQRVLEDEARSNTAASWLDTLPEVPLAAARELGETFAADDFRPIDPEMWQ